MPSREEMIAFLNKSNQAGAQGPSAPSRDEMISFLQKKQVDPTTIKGDQPASAALEGAGQAISAGYLNNIKAATEPAMFAIFNKATGQEVSPDDYLTARDNYNKQTEKLKSDNPKSFYAGMGAGGVVSALATPGLAAAKGATVGARLLSAAKTGAVIGGVSNPGDVEGQYSGLQLPERIQNAGVGMGAGALVQGAGEAIGPAIKSVGNGLKDFAETRAAKSMGATKALFKSEGRDGVRDIGRRALDEGIVSPLASTDEMISRAEALKVKGGAKMGEVYKTIDDAGASEFNPQQVATNVDEKIGGFWRSPINSGETKQLQNTLDSILIRGEDNIPLQEAQKLKEELGKTANWKNKLVISDKEQMARDAYGVVSKAIDDAAENGSQKVGVDGLKKTLQQGKSEYSTGANALKLLDNKSAIEGNKTLGLTDTIVGMGGYAALGPKGLAILAVKKITEKYGNQLAATSANNISKFLLRDPELALLAQKSPDVFRYVANQIEAKSASLNSPSAGPNLQLLPKAADQKQPTKGPDKWANDGIKKLQQHDKDSSLSPDVLEQLKKTQKGKDLLIRASDMKPGSKAMDKITNEIKSSLRIEDFGGKSSGIPSSSIGGSRLSDQAANEYFGKAADPAERTNNYAGWKSKPENQYDKYEPRNLVAKLLNDPDIKLSRAEREAWFQHQMSLEGRGDSVTGMIGGIDNIAGKAGGKVVSMFEPEVQALRQKRFGAELDEPIGKVKDLVRSNRKNFPELKSAPEAAPSSKFAMTNDGQGPWDMFRNRISTDDIAGNAKIEKAIREAGKSDQPYVDVGHINSAVPTIPNENVSAKIVGKPGISEPFNTKNPDQLLWMDAKYQVTKKHLESMKEPATINTSSDLIANNDYISALPKGSEVNIYATSPNESLNRILFPGNSSRARLEKAYEKLKESGVKVKWIEPTVDDVITAIENKTRGNWQSGAKSMSEIATESGSKVDKYLLQQLGVNINTSTAEGRRDLANLLQIKTKLSLIGKSGPE